MDVATQRPTWRKRLNTQLDPRAWPGQGLSPVNKSVCVLIIAFATLTILDTEPAIRTGRESLFTGMEWLFAFAFTLEYAARVWTSVESQRYGRGLAGRLKYVRSPAAMLDLIVLVSLLLSLSDSEIFILRFVRLFRILLLARLGRFSLAAKYIWEAMSARRHELLLSAGAALMLLVISASLMYLVEGDAQPETFGSIPRAMWWSVATLTTVGYGDTYPITTIGRILAGVTAIAGIGLIAMPAGILAAAFSEALRRREANEESHEE